MKKWLLVIVIVGLAGYEWASRDREDAKAELNTGTVQVSTDKGSKNLTLIPKGQIYKGDLLLVNKDYPVHETGVSRDIVSLLDHEELTAGYGLLDHKTQLSRQVAEKFAEMVQAASGEDINHFLISSGYRDNAKQKQLYEEKGADYALPPGYSEHNLGLSLDIGSSQMSMSHAPEGQWLRDNAWDYGFILRYPEDKTEITGIQYEPWHFRYVGLPHSIIMRDKNFTLEEYLEFLKQQQTITTTVNGTHYQISYIEVKGNTPVPVPAGQHIELSGDNMDGVIMTAESGDAE
ncbi:M15 family metallopeptidase [Paenibacillus tritici]|uniref:M15 family metallopeptidase n=1 Tax=Paenibacillus tritici TaxID=1873425 RepID=A0ABX2DHE7_9BACL|nr:M15 family metallopeptidase [Paenibacillus tritici]NQX43742.1 M15 family metallopeptidase [Paenibacillus tritici]